MTVAEAIKLLASCPQHYELKVPTGTNAPRKPVVSVAVDHVQKVATLDWYPLMT